MFHFVSYYFYFPLHNWIHKKVLIFKFFQYSFITLLLCPFGYYHSSPNIHFFIFVTFLVSFTFESVIWKRPYLHIFVKLVLCYDNVLLGIIHNLCETTISPTIYYSLNQYACNQSWYLLLHNFIFFLFEPRFHIILC